MNTWDVKRVVSLLVESGHIALSHYDSPSWQLKQDRSIVTEADKAVEALLAAEFDRPADGVHMIGEETIASRDEKYMQGALTGTTWIVDPIDGTAPYSHHIPTWGVSIGFAEEGVIKEGGIFLPATGEMFVTNGPQVLYSSCAGGRNSWNFSSLGELPRKERALNDGGMISISQGMAKHGVMEVKNPVQALCCAVMPLAYLCMGRYLAYVGALYVWDYAAGLAILKKCGMVARFRGGGEMTARLVDDCQLEADGIARWRARDDIIFAPSNEVADFVATHVSRQ